MGNLPEKKKKKVLSSKVKFNIKTALWTSAYKATLYIFLSTYHSLTFKASVYCLDSASHPMPLKPYSAAQLLYLGLRTIQPRKCSELLLV